MSNENGNLFVVATPIGNLGDMSGRAIEVLREVALIAAEDTRHSGRLLEHFGIETPLAALHEHNEREFSGRLIDRLSDGESIALISDAGTPLISDPGYHLVRQAHAHGIRIVPVPGPCAAIAALSVSGIPPDRFVFEGFLPVRAKARRERLAALAIERRTLIFFEAPHRIVKTIEDMAAVLGHDREVVITRELTKAFETVHKNRLGDLNSWLRADENRRRGEFVVVVAGCGESTEPADESEARRILELLLPDLPLKRAVTVATEITGLPRNRLYRMALGKDGGDEHS